MNQFDYRYNFDNIAEGIKKGQLQRIDCVANEVHKLSAAVYDSQLLINTSSYEVSSLLADLTDIAVAVYTADRLSQRKKNVTCRINIQLPIRSSSLLDRSSSIREQLQEILYWFTEDLWFFDFMPYTQIGRFSEVNKRLPIPDEPHPKRVALWSGGLDALAGLYHQLMQDTTTYYTLFGTGGNEMILHTQKLLIDEIKRTLPTDRLKLIQIPIRLKKEDARTSSSARVRGFVFMLLGAVCALQEEQNTLYIHENGIGAINLPFRDSEVGLDHSRSVHPLSLYRMSKFLSSMLETPFSFENPFLFSTKAQVCEKLLRETPELAFLTITCDSRHRRDPMQCGYCSSCLLRRQAIAALGKDDRTNYLVTELSRRQKKYYRTHLVAMLAQVNTLRMLLSSEDSWQSLSENYQTLDEIVQKTGGTRREDQSVMRHQFLDLYRNYISEWDRDRVHTIIKQGLLE
jgi:7-cyano-7-deazaguanine synthase in queuosine biosynthesis